MAENALDTSTVVAVANPKKLVRRRKNTIVASDFHQELTLTQKLFDEVAELDEDLLPLSPMEQATDLESLDKAVVEELRADSPSPTTQDTWVNDFSTREAFIGLPLIGQAISQPLVWSALDPMGAEAIASIFVGIIPGLLVSLALVIFAAYHPFPISFRNRVLMRKKYKRELRRVLVLNAHNLPERAKREKVRAAKLAKAQAKLKPLAYQYALANPGKTLSVTEDTKKIEAVKDDSFSELDKITLEVVDAPLQKPSGSPHKALDATPEAPVPTSPTQGNLAGSLEPWYD